VDDYVDVKPNDEIFGDNPDGWSYFIWFRRENDVGNESILSDVSEWNNSSAIDLKIENHDHSKYPIVLAYLTYGSSRRGIGKRGAYEDGRWFFIAVTVSKSDNRFKLYVHGEEMNDWKLPENPGDYFIGTKLRIGAGNPLEYDDRSNKTITPFNGTLDEIVLFNRTLTGTEILDYYKSGL
jgi:hypothetical protein